MKRAPIGSLITGQTYLSGAQSYSIKRTSSTLGVVSDNGPGVGYRWFLGPGRFP